MTHMDMSEVRSFANHLAEAGAATKRETRAVVERGANNIKRQLQAEMSGSRSFGKIASAINYDVREVGGFGGGFVEAEIGPGLHRRVARLENIAYFGTSRGGGTVADPLGALLDEMPRFEQAVADLAERSL